MVIISHPRSHSILWRPQWRKTWDYTTLMTSNLALRWRHNESDVVSNHRPHDCLLNRLFRHRSKKTSKLRVTGLCEGNSPMTSQFPHKGPVTRIFFPFDDVIMDTCPSSRSLAKQKRGSALSMRLIHIFDNINMFYSSLTITLLTHWGRVTHICVSELTIIGSDNGLSPGRRQAIIWKNAGVLLIESLGTNFSEIAIGI